MKTRRLIFGVLAAAGFAIGASLVGAILAKAKDQHDLSDPAHWYPLECCSGQDCAPVDSVSSAVQIVAGVMSVPHLVVTTKHGTAEVPSIFPRRESKDHRMHACMRRRAGEMELLCLFLPPGS